jgi:Protein of unknown function (DUF5131)
MDRLPKSMHAQVRRVLRQAWELDDGGKAETLLRNLARHLEKDWEGVSASILEGFDKMLTVTKFGLPPEPRRSLACTNRRRIAPPDQPFANRRLRDVLELTSRENTDKVAATKRSSLMRDFLRQRYPSTRGPLHMWFGVSVEDGSKKSRIRHLQEAPTGVRFVSIEPLIGPMGNLDLAGIDWVIAKGLDGAEHILSKGDRVKR